MNEIWDVIFEQEKAKEILTKMYNRRRVPHAFLFFGPDGVGKYFTAIQFAKLINKSENDIQNQIIQKKISSLQEPFIKIVLPLPRGKGESGEDSSMEKLSKEVLDFIYEELKIKIENPYHRIAIENANTIKISSVREIKKYITTTTDDIGYKFILILDAHKMNETAQNALLKSLEEPPEGIVFVFLTSDKEKLLPTIKSRCWQVNFEPLSFTSVSKILTNYFAVDSKLSEKVAKYSEGSPLIALDLINNHFENIFKKTISILRFTLAKKYHSAYREISEFLKNSSDQSINILSKAIKTWLNDVTKNRHSNFDYYFNDYSDTLTKFNNKYSDADINKIYYLIDNLERLQINNVNLNVVCLNLIFEIASLSIRK